MLRTLLLALFPAFSLSPANGVSAEPELAAQRETVLDCVDGRAPVDAERLERALHPDFPKKNIRTREGNDRNRLGSAGKIETAEDTRAGGGRGEHASRGKHAVTVAAVVVVVGAAAWTGTASAATACADSPLFALNTNSTSTVYEGIPATVGLVAVHPNPFNPATTIRYRLAHQSPVELVVFDAAGRRVRTLRSGTVEPAGERSAAWDGTNDARCAAPSGMYLVRLRAGGQSVSRRLTLIK